MARVLEAVRAEFQRQLPGSGGLGLTTSRAGEWSFKKWSNQLFLIDNQ
jgi:hypothetical protein